MPDSTDNQNSNNQNSESENGANIKNNFVQQYSEVVKGSKKRKVKINQNKQDESFANFNKQENNGNEIIPQLDATRDGDYFINNYDDVVELEPKDPNKKKRHFKMLSSFTILFIIIAILVLVSWILHWTGVHFTHAEQPSQVIKAMGIVDIFYSVFEGFSERWDTIVFILVIGAFVTIVINSKALNGFAQVVAKKLKGKEVIAIIPLMLFFSICGTVEGFAEETLGFYMICIPVMMMVGFDKFTGVMVVLLGAGVGVLSSTVNPFIVSMAAESINQGAAQQMGESNATLISIGDGLVWRLVTWFLLTSATIGFVMWYALHTRKNPQKSITFSTYEGDKAFFLGTEEENIKMDWRKITTLIVFLLSFIIMIVYLINWDNILSINTMQHAGQAVNKHAPYITALIPGFGYGGLAVTGAFFLIASIVVGLINWIGEDNFVKQFMEGAADILSVCLVIATAGGVTVILQNSGLQDLFVSGLSSFRHITPIARVIVLYLIFIPLSFIIPSSSGFATAIFPVLTSVVTVKTGTTLSIDPVVGSGSIQAFSFATGMINLFSPTSGVVMGAVALSRTEYKTYLKGIMPIIGVFFVLGFVFLAIGGAIASTSTGAIIA